MPGRAGEGCVHRDEGGAPTRMDEKAFGSGTPRVRRPGGCLRAAARPPRPAYRRRLRGLAASTKSCEVTETPRPHPDVSWRRLGDEVVIVHLKTNQIYRLNRTAARFWELVAEGSD